MILSCGADQNQVPGPEEISPAGGSPQTGDAPFYGLLRPMKAVAATIFGSIRVRYLLPKVVFEYQRAPFVSFKFQSITCGMYRITVATGTSSSGSLLFLVF